MTNKYITKVKNIENITKVFYFGMTKRNLIIHTYDYTYIREINFRDYGIKLKYPFTNKKRNVE